MNDVLQIVRDGVKVKIAIDLESAIITSVVLFAALTLALLVYGKLIR